MKTRHRQRFSCLLTASTAAMMVISISLLPSLSTAQEESSLSKARTLLKAGCHLEAIDLLEKAAKQSPRDADILSVLGQAYFLEARHLIRHLETGKHRRMAGEIKFRLMDAADRCEEAVRLNPADYEAYYYLGLANLFLDPPDGHKAAKALSAAGPLKTGEPEYHFHLGLALHHAGELVRAARAYQEAARLYRARKETRGYALTAYIRSGVCHAGAGDHDSAAGAFKAAFTLDPENLATFQELWKIYAADRKLLASGIRVLKHLERSRPKSPLPPYYLGFMYRTLGKKPESRKAFECVLKRGNGSRMAEAWARVGASLYHEDRDEERAEQYCVKALGLDAGNRTATRVLQTMVSRFIEGHDLARAENLTRIILRFDPENGLEWANLGLFLRDQRRYGESWQAYRKAVHYAPDRAQVLNDAGVVLHYHLNRRQEAVHLYEKAVELDPDTIDALENLGVVYFDRGEYNRALTWFRKAIRIQPRRAKSLRYVNRIEEALKLTDPGF